MRRLEVQVRTLGADESNLLPIAKQIRIIRDPAGTPSNYQLPPMKPPTVVLSPNPALFDHWWEEDEIPRAIHNSLSVVAEYPPSMDLISDVFIGWTYSFKIGELLVSNSIFQGSGPRPLFRPAIHPASIPP